MVRFLPQRGFESEYTQALANHLPVWNRIRFDPTATGQYMLNAFSEGVSEIFQFLKNARKDLYIGTADTLVRTYGYRASVPQKIRGRQNRGFNFLRNASFKKQGQAWRNQPLEWQVTSGETYTADTTVGHASIQLENPSGEFFQIVSGEEFRKGQSYTASIWLKSSVAGETGNGTLTIDSDGWGWNMSDQLNFDLGTEGEWVRETLTVIPTGDIRSFTFKVSAEPTGEINTLFSGPMLQEGNSANNWEPGRDLQGANFRVYMAGPTGEEQQLIELSQVLDSYDLFEDAIPTRIVTTSGITGDLLSDSYAPPYYEWTKDVWDSGFRISGDLIERYSMRVPGDVWNSYTILDRYMDNEVNTGEYGYTVDEVAGFTRTLESLCVWRRRIYLVLKDTYGGNDYRVLKVLRWQGIDNSLETIHEVRIGMDTGEVSSIGFVEGKMDQMGLVMSNAEEYTMQFYYDVFLYDEERRQVVLRHPYTGYTLTFSEL